MLLYVVTLFYIILIFLAYLIQTAPLTVLNSWSEVRPNLIHNVLFLGFIYFKKTKMLFFILLVIALVELGSVAFFGFYLLTYLFSFVMMLLYLDKFLPKFYNFFFFFLVTYFSKALMEINFFLFSSENEDILKYISKTVFDEFLQSFFICLVGYFIFVKVKLLLKIKKLI